MLRMRPHMGERRRSQIDAAVASYEERPNRGASKLTEEQVRRVRQLLRENKTVNSIAAACGVSTHSVLRIKNHGAFPDVI